jgi:hypothetical protein
MEMEVEVEQTGMAWGARGVEMLVLGAPLLDSSGGALLY